MTGFGRTAAYPAILRYKFVMMIIALSVLTNVLLSEINVGTMHDGRDTVCSLTAMLTPINTM